MFVLRLEQTILRFLHTVQEQSIELDPMNSFYRLLAHRLADYYDIGHTSNLEGTSVVVYKLAEMRPPSVRLCDIDVGSPTPNDDESPKPEEPVKKKPLLLKKRQPQSSDEQPSNESATSTPDQVSSEQEKSEETSGSVTPTSRLAPLEAREAAYQEARARIFQNFSSRPNNNEEEGDDDDDDDGVRNDKTGALDPTFDPEYARIPVPQPQYSYGYFYPSYPPSS
ncbi:hypothetical protein TRICI_000908 [Trichomonascus ciferrii]|uniref:SUZ domain-containing protein n=1 Tax=Trichomonascus ciferrii TaxID=44093 RepID=A0A642VAT5_9ASCO|nr:hypothetical protein TRICI_000908 [Trichomonascus ciferrii]